MPFNLLSKYTSEWPLKTMVVVPRISAEASGSLAGFMGFTASSKEHNLPKVFKLQLAQ